METKNRLIAEFMAGKPVETHHNQYHENWNELIPVIEKCRERQIFGSQGLINNIDNRLIQLDLLATHGNVVSFIEFYNLKK
jgi:hypothetical protein